MRTIKKKYIVNERNEKIAVQLDIKTFEKIERVMEDYVLGEKMTTKPIVSQLTRQKNSTKD